MLIGIDLGGTNVRAAVVTRKGEVVEKAQRPTDAEGGPTKVVDNIVAVVKEAMERAGVGNGAIIAGAVGAPGPMNWQTGVVYSPPNLPGWKDVPLAEMVTSRLGFTVYVDNDANAACYGEFWSGAARDVDSCVMLTLGTGVGGGIVVEGRLLRGIDGTAAEIGHMCVARGGRLCNCGAHGCLEQYASVSGLVRTAADGIKDGRQTVLTERAGGDLENLTGKMISDAAQEGDAFAQWVIEETGRWLGVGIGSLINLLNPEMVILYGGMTAAGDMLFTPVRDMALAQAFEVPGKRAQIVTASLGDDAGVIGAAGCALQRAER
jgi:glucokinase